MPEPLVIPCRTTSEELDPTAITPEHAIDLLVGEGDSYYHCRIKRILAEAGLTLWRLERDEVHPVWVAWIRPGKAELAMDKMEAARQIRRILNRGGLKIPAGDLTVFVRRKDMIHFTFLFPWGCAGVLT